MTWHGRMWHDVTWRDITWHDVTWRGRTWHDVTWHDMTWHDVTGRGMTWHDVAWRGKTWHHVTWQDVTWRDMAWYSMTWHDRTWHDMTWQDVTGRDVTWRDMTGRDMTWHDVTLHDNTVDNKALIVWPSSVFCATAYKFRVFLSRNECLGNYENLSNRELTWISRSLKHDSSVGMSAMDSLTSKTWIVKKFQKSTRHNHQYLRVPVEPEVYLDFRGHLNMVAL